MSRATGPRLWTLLLGANAVVLLSPFLAALVLEVYDDYLLRQTERQLLAQSVVIAEAYREAWLTAQGRASDEHRPPGKTKEPFLPVEPVIDIGVAMAGPESVVLRDATSHDPIALVAGRAIEPMMRRAQTFNLSAIRVLDPAGCVVATTRSDAGKCLDALPEVRSALEGRYASLARRRVSDEPKPPFGSIRRRGERRVFTALPVFSDGRVIAVVGASRTGLDALSSLWENRRGLLTLALGLGALLTVVSFVSASAVVRPLSRLARRAKAVARGADAKSFEVRGFAPAEVRMLSEAFNDMTEQLSTRARYVSDFASHVSHELRTPITAIRGAAELLSQSAEEMTPAEREHFVANILDDALRMERLLVGLLTLARIDNAARAPQPQIRVVESTRSLLARYGNAVHLELDDPPQELLIESEHLAMVLTNLVDNGLRHGAGRPVRVRLSGERDSLRIEVFDEGSGISEANLPRVFERFFTTERDRGGTGLGLAIVKAIAEARGGRVAVTSGPNGSHFTLVL